MAEAEDAARDDCAAGAEICVTPQRWQRLQELFLSTANLPTGEQRAFLETSCGDDAELLAEALGMLEMDREGHSLLGGDVGAFTARAFEEEQDPYLGMTFGAYHFKSRLGEGGMSWVYLVERSDYDGIVAVKVLRDGLSPERRQLFDYEKRLLAQLNHPSIARLYDAGTLDDGAAFFAMEYVDGLSITEYCIKRNLDFRSRLDLFRQVCEAVRYAHVRGIIHRDLKPSNILVQVDGTIKLLDFGVSERIDDARTTHQSSSYMTLAYAAPEQLRHEHADVRADIYSLGVILQQLLTGRLPFDLTGKSNADIHHIVLEQHPRKPSFVARQRDLRAGAAIEVSPDSGIDPQAITQMDWQDIDHICSMTLAKKATARYASVESLTRELDRFLHKRPLESRQQSRKYVGARFLQRNRRSIVFTTLVACCIVGLVAFYTFRLRRARNEAVAEAARTARVEKFMERLMTGDDPNNGPALDLRVVTVLEHGVRDAKALNTDPPIQAELYQTLADIYGTMNNFEVAEPLFRAALEKQRNLYGPQSVQVAETLTSLSMMRTSEGKLDQAEETIRAALTIDRDKLVADHPQTIEASIALGIVLNYRGAYKEAVPILEKAAHLASGKPDSTYNFSAALSNLANAYFYLGDLERAETLNLQALEIDRKLKGDENIDIAEDLLSLASLNQRIGHLPKAEEEERRALSIEQHWYQSQDHTEIASGMTQLAETLVSEKRYSEALPMIEDALSMRIRMQESPSSAFAHTWNTKGQIDEKLTRFNQAEKDQFQALDMYRTVFQDANYHVGVCLDDLSAVSFDLKRFDQAGQYSRQALDVLRAKLQPGDMLIAKAEANYGRALVAQGHFEEAEKQYLAAYATYSSRKEPRAEEINILHEDLAALYKLEHEPEKSLSHLQ